MPGMVGEVDLAAAQGGQPGAVGVGGDAQHVRGPADEHGAVGDDRAGGMRVPSPRMQPSPSREPGMRMAPLPISHRSPTRAPTMVAR